MSAFEMITLLASVTLLVAIGIDNWRWRARHERAADDAAMWKKSAESAEMAMNHAIEREGYAIASEARAKVQCEEAEQKLAAAEAQAKADRDHLRMYQEKVIPNVIKERDRWHDIATEDAAGYGAAQNLMMQHLDRMAKIANRPLPKQVVDLQRIIADRAPVTQTERVPESEHQAGVVVKLPPLKGKTWNGTEPPPDGAA